MITDTTGLSDKAISKIQEMKQTQQIDTLNLLLESVVFHVEQYLKFRSKAKAKGECGNEE